MQDGVELAASLRDAMEAAAISWVELPTPKIEQALRDLERRRSFRCAPLVAQAREYGRQTTLKRSWLVGSRRQAI